MKQNEIIIDQAPNMDGLRFRKFAGEADFPTMLRILGAVTEADQEDRATTLDDLKHDYSHLTHSDPDQDMIFAEVNGETIAYSRVEWWQEDDPNHRIYSQFVNILPKWRYQGIETAMIGWCEARLREIAKTHPKDSQRFFQTYSSGYKPKFNQLLEELGFSPARFFIEMSRSLDEIPAVKLPDDIKVHPADEKDIRKVWDASVEAFRDHWGYTIPKEEDFISYKASKFFQPELWQVAWEGDQVVSSVMNFIEHDYNKKFKKKRGWTENISTRKEWRCRGIAKALIVRSMRMFKEKGFTEVALGVDTNNLSGALKLYQSLGYEKDKTWITYRKEMGS